MGSLHNLRFLRFLIVLSAVVLTIFIYASYSSSTSLTPPHMRAGTPTASALSGQDHHHHPQHVQLLVEPAAAAAAASNNKTFIGADAFVGAAAESASNRMNGSLSAAVNANAHNIHTSHNSPKVNKKAATASAGTLNGVMLAKKSYHREPTIDADAVAGGAGNALDDVPDESALERFVNNDLLEEQYGQNVDNMLANINNSNVTGVVQSQQQQQQQPSDEQLQPKQQQNQLEDNNNNLNKILDSDVLIPTSNLQKFIENADKILKNITVNSSPAIKNIKSSDKDEPIVPKSEEKQDQQQSASPNSNINDDINNDNDVALPPSVVMTIKHGSDSAPKIPALQPAVEAKKNNPKVTPKGNTTVHANVDPINGIPTQQIYESGHMNEELNIPHLCPNKGADLKLLILITSAQAHADARLAIRQTWAHYGIRRDVSTAFILGRSTNETLNTALTQENFIYGDLIRGNFIDSYNNLTLKTVSALEWVDLHCSSAKFILKTDDDMFINVPKLLTFLDKHSKEKRVIYGRLAKKWKPIRNKKSKYYVSTGQFGAPVFPPFTTGPAYVISSDIIHELYVRSLHQVYLKLEDVFTTGIVAQQLNIKRVHVNEFLNRRIAFNPCNIRKTISVHMIKSNEQFDLWKKLLDQTTKCK